MSRMILVFVALAIVSGCYCDSVPRRLSLMKARVDTMAPVLIRVGRANGDCADCDGCVPHRPYTLDYFSSWDYHLTRFTGHCCGYREFNDYQSECGRPLSCHFKSGFLAAYEDLALNRRPQPPVVPPTKYWNAYYRSCAGQPDVQDWFAGYEAGLDQGYNSGVSRFQEVYLRRCGDATDPNKPANRFNDGRSGGVNIVQPPPAPMSPSPDMPTQPPAIYSSQPNPYGQQPVVAPQPSAYGSQQNVYSPQPDVYGSQPNPYGPQGR